MFAALQNKVVTLDRIRIGRLTEDSLERGHWRILGKRDLKLILDNPDTSAGRR